MANNTKATVSNIDIYNKNKVAELKVIQKFLNHVFSPSTTTSTPKKTTTTKAKKTATTTSTNSVSGSEPHVQ